MSDYAAFATGTGKIYLASIGADGLIHGVTTCMMADVEAHLAAVPGTVAVMPDEIARFSHGGAFALVEGAVMPASFPLPVVKARQAASLRAACAVAITGGYASAALGTAHTYPSTPTDQANMISSVTASLLPGLAADWSTPFWCADPEGVWAFRPHTATQIQQAGTDGKAAIVAAQTRLAGLLAQVTAATTEDQVLAVTW